VIHRLTGATPTVSLHIPLDKADPADLRDKAAELGLAFDAMKSNTFSDAPGQPLSYKFGSPGAPRRPRRARGLPGGERRADGYRDAEGGLPRRRRADPCDGAP
jgi:L-rhamnose isomerase